MDMPHKILSYLFSNATRMNSSVMANLKHAFGGQTRDLVDPYVQVSFAGLSVCLDSNFRNYQPSKLVMPFPGNISLICISRQPYSLAAMDQLEKKLQKNQKEITHISLPIGYRQLYHFYVWIKKLFTISYFQKVIQQINILPPWGISFTPLRRLSRIAGAKYK